MPCRTTSDLALHDRRARLNVTQILVVGLPTMSDQSATHDGRLSTHCAMGTRESTRCDAEAARPHSAGFANTPPDRRASLRHAESMDGSDAFSDQDETASEYGDELACAGLQPEACDGDCRNRPAHEGNEGLNSPFCRM